MSTGIAPRGRPAGKLTHRRQQVLDDITASIAAGERVTFASIARRLNLHDYRDARRIVGDLKRMGRLPTTNIH